MELSCAKKFANCTWSVLFLVLNMHQWSVFIVSGKVTRDPTLFQGREGEFGSQQQFIITFLSIRKPNTHKRGECRGGRGDYTAYFKSGELPVHITETHFNPCVPLKVFAVLIDLGLSGWGKCRQQWIRPGNILAWSHFWKMDG